MNWLVLIFALAASPLPDQATQWEIRIEELEGRMEMLESKLEALEARQPEFPKTVVTGGTGVTTRRDPKQVHEFRKMHACPPTLKTTGPCKGWVVDHIVPLCWGGADHPNNMTWQETGVSHLKDDFERAACAMKRKLEGK